MTTAYLHLTDTDKPATQTAIAASFVDENGKHVDIGGGGTTEIHTDTTLAGTGTDADPLKLSDTTSEDIAKAGTLTEDNLRYKGNVTESHIGQLHVTLLEACKNSSGKLSLMFYNDKGLSMEPVFGGVEALTVPAIPALAAISTLDSSASLTDVVNKVNEILNAVKNAN